jgi:hypothetical protein
MTRFLEFKIVRIVMSRFRKENNFSKERMQICVNCEFNTKNMNKISLKQKIINFLSNVLTFLTTGKFNISTLSYKVAEEDEICPAKPSKWKSIYIPNSAQNKKE